MIHLIWRMVIAALCFVAFLYITPLFLAVLEVSVGGNLWQLIKALGVCLAIAYVLWGTQKYPWGPPA